MRAFPVEAAPHLPPRRSVRQVMLQVIAALLPGIAVHAWLFGPGVFVQIALALIFALALEAVMLRVRGQPLRPFIGDGSAALTAVLFALCLPPLVPWWISAVGMVAAIVFAKHLYGGLGSNLFNPAMVGYAVVLVGFPREMTQWMAPRGLDLPPGWSDSLAAIVLAQPPGTDGWDALTRATPLDTLRTASVSGQTMGEIAADPVFGSLGGLGWEWLALAWLAGGLFLMWRRLIPWQVPVGVVGTVLLLTVPVWLWEPDLNPFPLQHLATGGLVLAAFFIATDPVSGCTTPRGRLLFGIGVAALTLAIRRWGAYPDGVVFAILLMNCAAPWIDRYSRPRIYGERQPVTPHPPGPEP